MAKTPKKIKDHLLAARIDEDFEAKVVEYTDAADLLTADLVRKAVKEYMLNHPIKTEVPGQTELIKPGKE